MKLPNESLVLGVVGCVCVIIICLSSLVLEYGWFGYGEVSEPSAVISHGVTSAEMNSDVSRLGGLNINTATISQLKTLPGVGEELARRIVLYRQLNGNFSEISQLLDVPGMDENTLIDINPLIVCE
ncbi:MAG: helix-hairpin-helix domain-containing protein [Clostridia bacterium]|nr:helix-hairpin-helix domain-containing protein [Clostridia bacterium]